MKDRYRLFTTLITRCSRAVKRIKSSEMAEFDLKGLHVSCLYYLYVNEVPMTATELCDVCDEDKANVSRAIDFLEQNGFVICHSKTHKKYNCPIELTAKGEDIGKRLNEKINGIVAEAGLGVSDEERKVFYSSLAAISDNLDKISEEYQGK